MDYPRINFSPNACHSSAQTYPHPADKYLGTRMSPNNFYFVNSNLNLDTVIKTSTWIIMRHQIHCELYNFLRDHLTVCNICYLRNEKEAERHMHTVDTMTRNYAPKKKNIIRNDSGLRFKSKCHLNLFSVVWKARWKRKSTLSSMTQIMAMVFSRHFLYFVDIICLKEYLTSTT